MLATLTALGWTFMLLSCGGVTFLTYWCFKKVLFPAHDEPDLPSGLGA
jgi:uncharacterized integral membrane protein